MVIVSGSGLIYGVIVVMWAAVLVPMWLRRHEDADEQYTTAMRVLAHRRGASDEVVAEATSGGPAGGVVAGAGATEYDEWPVGSRTGVLERRRRTLVALVALTAVLLLSGLLGLAGWMPLLASFAALVAYVVYLRRQVVAAAEARRRRVERPESPRTGEVATEAEQAPGVAMSEPPPARGPAERPRGESWQPVRIPPPTYTTKPPAPSPARTIDLSRPGFWAEGWRIVARPSSVADGVGGERSDDGHGDDWYIGADGRVTRRHDSAGEVEQPGAADELFDQEAPEHRWAVGD